MQNIYGKTFLFGIQNGGLYRDGVFVILKSPYFQNLQSTTNTKTKNFMDLQRIYTQKIKKNQLVCKLKNSTWRQKSRWLRI
jgi:hypothetical protein